MSEYVRQFPCVETRFGRAGLINGLKKRMYCYSNFSVPLVVLGPPGTGKTVLSTELMAGVKPWRRVFVSRSKASILNMERSSDVVFVLTVVEPGQPLELPKVWLTEAALLEQLRKVVAANVPTLFVFDEMRYERMGADFVQFLSSMVKYLYRKRSMLVFASQVIPCFLNEKEVSVLHLQGVNLPVPWEGARRGSLHVAVELGNEPDFLKGSLGFVDEAVRYHRHVERAILSLEDVDVSAGPGSDLAVEARKTGSGRNGSSEAEPLVVPFSKHEASLLAKERLKEMKRSDPSAKLGHAYDAMAVSLGFPNWNVMRARLEG